MNNICVFTAVAALTCSCASTPFFGSLSPQAARRAADRDIQTGHLRVFVAGTRASTEVGIDNPEDLPLVRNLPRDRSLPIGCTAPHASEAIDYARAYNWQIVRYLRLHPEINAVPACALIISENAQDMPSLSQ